MRSGGRVQPFTLLVFVLGSVFGSGAAKPLHAQDLPAGAGVRSNISFGAGPLYPMRARAPFDHRGGTYQAAISVGDDVTNVGMVLEYATFGPGPFTKRGARLASFLLRTDFIPLAPARVSPLFRIGGGVYALDPDRAAKSGSERRFGVTGGAGVRVALGWQNAVTLLASYAGLPNRDRRTLQMASVSLELLHWSD